MLLRNLNIADYLYNQLEKKGWQHFEEKFKKLNAKGRIDSSTFNRLQSKIVVSNNPSWILNFAYFENANTQLLYDTILKTGNVKYIAKFVCTKNVDLSKVLNSCDYRDREQIYSYLLDNRGLIDNFASRVIKLQDASAITYMLHKLSFADFSKYKKEINDIVIQSKDAGRIISVAGSKYADLDRLTDAIIEINNSNAIISMATIKGANQEKLFDAVLKKKDPYSLELFIKDVDVKEVLKLQDLVIKTKDPEKIFKFAVAEKDADYIKIIKALKRLKSSEYLVRLALELQERYGYNDIIEKIVDYVIELKRPEGLYDASRIKEADLNRIVDTLCETNAAKYIYFMAEKIGLGLYNCNDGELINKLTEAVINTNDEKYILEFMQRVENKPKESQTLLAQKACEMNELNLIYWSLNNFKLEKPEKEMAVQAINSEGCTELVLNNSANSYTYACLANSISEDEKTALVETVCNYGSSEQVCAFAKNVGWLTDEHKDMLIGNICDRATRRSNAEYVCWFAQNIDWITAHDKSTLVKGAIASEDEKGIFYCAYYLDNLTDHDYKRLEFAIHTINMNHVCNEIRLTRKAIEEGFDKLSKALWAINGSINEMSRNICNAISRGSEKISNSIETSRPIIIRKRSLF